MIYGLSDADVKQIAACVYAENRGGDDKALIHTASSIFNRLGQGEWADKSLPQVLREGYSAVGNPKDNKGWEEAMGGKFPDDESANVFKNIYAKVAAINRGKLQPTKTQFYFKQPEINRLSKKKSFDFGKVEEGESFGLGKNKFRTFHYPNTPPTIPAVTKGVEGSPIGYQK